MANKFNSEKRKNLKKDSEEIKKEISSRKKKLLLSSVITAFVLIILAVIVYIVIPAFDGRYDIRRSEIITGNFYSQDEITKEMLEEYETDYKYVGNITYTIDGQTAIINSKNAYSFGGADAQFFLEYFKAVSEGDHKAYSLLFSDDFDLRKDPFASGKVSFPPQRIYDVKVEVADTTPGDTKGTFFVDYRIYCNEGDFRIDIDKDSAYSPLVFETEKAGDNIKITNIYHRYGNK